jgi:16S rRNA (uracil1498-N3)-methyltransferase
MQIFLALKFDVDGNILLSPEESKHCVKVLRKKSGDIIHVIDGKGNLYEAELFETDPQACKVKIINKKQVAVNKNYRLHIAISPTKNPDRIEWMVEKCTEMGVDEFSFIVCKRTEKPTVKLERLQKIAESAVKQSIQGIIPIINNAVSFKEFITLSKSTDAKKYIAHCVEETKIDLKNIISPSKNIILIGPEGDFTEEEIKLALESGYGAISLGETRLRTETAGLFVAAGFKAH